jgi:serine/threonine-protein kinase RsbW
VDSPLFESPLFESTLDSTIESVDDVEESVRQFARDSGFAEPDQYFIGLATREILLNAVRHGNRFDGGKKVGLRMSRSGTGLTIEVTDEGEGFDLERVPDARLPENRERKSGRGLTIAHAIMDEFSVGKGAPGGAHVRMGKRLPAA